MSRTRIAYFDVDGTLTTATGLFRFLSYYLASAGRPPQAYEHARHRLRTMTLAGAPREETNRAYFDNLAGAGAARITALARAWFRAEVAHGGFLNPHAVTALREHQRAGDRVVLVSGSFPAILAPLTDHLGTDETWCTSPEILAGRYTGRLAGPPMIGRRKADAVAMSAAAHDTDPRDCVAYGDHASDLPMLEAAGTAVVVGGDDDLRELARLRGWRLLPSVPGPTRFVAPDPEGSTP